MMKIQEQDRFHGAALAQIVKHNSFKALNKASTKYGHYRVNADRHVFVKYSTEEYSPWRFTFQKDDLKAIQTEVKKGTVFICLVCGTYTVCALTIEEFQALIDLDASSKQSWVRVEVPPRGSCHASGNLGPLKKAIPHNSFPDKVFE